ncbi:MAG: class I SAM-dependent methyltransferase [Allosphingosinicella sp.]
MTATDVQFAGSIPEFYDRCLGPFLFEPYAADLAGRAAALRPKRILETAAGTGIVTRALAAALPEARIVATDLNPDMLEVAARKLASERVTFAPADAQSLPFPDAGFDLVVCQFGAMFFPDRVAAYREALRALRPGGAFLFNVWDRLDANPASQAVAEAVAALFPGDPPSFISRVPFGYHDKAAVEADLRAAGFARVESETVARRSRGSARDVAPGLCQGSPLRSEIEARAPERLDEATGAALAELIRRCGDPVDAAISAHVFTARG